MLQKERQDQLLKILQERRYASITELAGEIFVSTATIRRDLKILEQQGLVHLSYGGVSLSQSGRKNVPLPLRQAEHVAVKQRIAQRAATLIQPHDTIIMDGSSTVQHIAEFLTPDMDLTIFTYCVDTAALLARKNIPVHCLGGQYQLHSAVTTGYFAEKNAEMITADLCFLSSQGLNTETGFITDSSAEETRLRQIFMRQSKRRIFLCDSSKFGQNHPFILANIQEMDEIISDENI
ncbi:MAG: DeoR/GlpR transcriptional regulator [Clostridia bacterium]|nr:DeoR/GlpR transcriptional regulator [Clostridia bacterium]